MSLPEPTATHRQSFATHPRPTSQEDNAYRRSVVLQAVDRARMGGASPVTTTEVRQGGWEAHGHLRDLPHGEAHG